MMNEEALRFDPQRILFHGGGLLLVDKPAGLPVHKDADHPQGLADSIEVWVSLNPGVLDIRPGKDILPVHLTHREVSGVLPLALSRSMARKTHDAYTSGAAQLRYLAVVAGPLPGEGTLKGKIRTKTQRGNKYQATELTFRLLGGDDRLSLVEILPQGGRTQQIRPLLAQSGHPLAGDSGYGKTKPATLFLEKFGLPHFLLHAHQLTLPRAVLGSEKTFVAPIPDTFARLCQEKGWETEGS